MRTRSNHGRNMLVSAIVALVGCGKILGIHDVPEATTPERSEPGRSDDIPSEDAGTTDPFTDTPDRGGCAFESGGTLCGPSGAATSCGDGGVCCRDLDSVDTAVCRINRCVPPEDAWECEDSRTCKGAVCCANVAAPRVIDPAQCPILGDIEGGSHARSSCLAPGQTCDAPNLALCKLSDPTPCPTGSTCMEVSFSIPWLRGTVGVCVPTP